MTEGLDTSVSILVIEDDAEYRAVMREMLQEQGFNVIEASNGQEGVELYQEHKPDMIITDIFMPEKDGLEFMQELKKELKEDFTSAKLICISGGLDDDISWMTPLADMFGAFSFIKKPFGYDDLMKVIQEIL